MVENQALALKKGGNYEDNKMTSEGSFLYSLILRLDFYYFLSQMLCVVAFDRCDQEIFFYLLVSLKTSKYFRILQK